MARKEKGTQSFHHASEKSTRLLTRSFARLCEDLRLVVCNLIEDTLPEFLRELPVLFARPAERELTLCLSISQGNKKKNSLWKKEKAKKKEKK